MIKEFCSLHRYLDFNAGVAVGRTKGAETITDLISYVRKPNPSKSNFESIRESLNEVILLVNNYIWPTAKDRNESVRCCNQDHCVHQNPMRRVRHSSAALSAFKT